MRIPIAGIELEGVGDVLAGVEQYIVKPSEEVIDTTSSTWTPCMASSRRRAWWFPVLLRVSMRMPILGIVELKGVGDVLAGVERFIVMAGICLFFGASDVHAGRVELYIVRPEEVLASLPAHTASDPCTQLAFTVELHHQRVDQACPGENAGLGTVGMDKIYLPRSGDVTVHT